MSEKQKYCPRCDRQTAHEEWSVSCALEGEGAGERLVEGLLTFGLSELGRATRCECLRCGYQRKVR